MTEKVSTDRIGKGAADFLTAEQLEAMTGTPASTFRYWATNGTGDGPPSFKLGRRRVWARADVELWLEAQRNRPLQRTDRPAARAMIFDEVDALVARDYARATAIIPATAENAALLEACGVIIRLLAETGRPAERLAELRRDVVSGAGSQ